MRNIQCIFESSVQLGRMADESAKGRIEAMVTTWGPREGVDGRRFFYTPAPFEAWYENFQQAGRPLPMYFQHQAEADLPVGQWTEFVFTDEGMQGVGNLYMNTSAGADLYNIMKESPRMVGGVSVGAYADEFQMVTEDGDPFEASAPDDDMSGYFQIVKGGLHEVSIVMQPNNLHSRISRLEYWLGGKINPRAIEVSLRDAGLTRLDAKKASSFVKTIWEQHSELPSNPQVVSDSDERALLDALSARELLKALANRSERNHHA